MPICLWPHGGFTGGTSDMGLAPGAGDCGRNGRAVLVCANWVLICAYGGVLSSRVGVLKDLAHKGLWATSMDNKYRPEN